MLKGCLKSLAMLAGFIAIYYYFLHGRITPPGDRWGALALGFGMWIVSGLVWNALIALSHRRKLQHAGASAEQFEDGQVIAVAGTIRPLAEPLLAPFSRRPCVAFEYRMRSSYRSRGSQTAPQVSGESLAPSVIEGPTASARLLAWPFLQHYAETQFDGEDHRQNARDYVAATQFEQATVSSAISKLKELLADDDGSIKVDMNNGGDIDAGALLLSEKIVPAGARVCAIGKWSAAKGGIVPDPDSTAGVELIPGSLDDVLSKLRKKAVGFFVGAIVMTAVIHAIGFLVLTLYEADARPRRIDDFHQTVIQDDPEAVAKALKTMAPFVNVPNSEHRTSLLFARGPAVTKLLLDAGADVLARDVHDQTALGDAAIRGDVESMKLLLDRGADIDARNDDGTTPLMFAAQHESLEPLRFLVVRRPNLELRDEDGRSAFDLGTPGAQEILRTAGAIEETPDTTTAPRLPGN